PYTTLFRSGRAAGELPKQAREEEEEEEAGQSGGRADVGQAMPKVGGQAHDAGTKSIGLPSTPYEKKVESPGDARTNPNRLPTIGPQAREEEGRAAVAGGQGTYHDKGPE